MTTRQLQKLVANVYDYPVRMCAEENLHGEPLPRTQTWTIISDTDRRMFVNYANRHLAWYVCTPRS